MLLLMFLVNDVVILTVVVHVPNNVLFLQIVLINLIAAGCHSQHAAPAKLMTSEMKSSHSCSCWWFSTLQITGMLARAN